MKEFTAGKSKLKLDGIVIVNVEILISCMKCVRHKGIVSEKMLKFLVIV